MCIRDRGIISQIGSTNQKIEAICGVSPVLMRPPGGYIDTRSLSVVGNMGTVSYTHLETAVGGQGEDF